MARLAAAAQETIDATAMGTSTQLGKNVGVKMIITSWSTKEDQKTLSDAFKPGQNQGLVQGPGEDEVGRAGSRFPERSAMTSLMPYRFRRRQAAPSVS